MGKYAPIKPMDIDPGELEPSFRVRIFLVLHRAMQTNIFSTDECLLTGEEHTRRKGNAKHVGRATAYCRFQGWIEPVLPTLPGCRNTQKSRRKARKAGSVELWTRTATTEAAYRRFAKLITQRPPQRTLFD